MNELIIFYTIILSIGIGLYYISNHKSLFFSNSLYDLFILASPLIVYFLYSDTFSSIYLNSTFNDKLPIVLYLITLVTIIWYIFYYNNILNYFIWGTTILLSFIILIGLLLLFYLLGNYLKSFDGITGKIINFIFYVPCLLSNIIDYIISEFRITTKPVLIVFVIELILILIYITMPWLMDKYLSKNSISIYNNTTLLNEPVIIPMHENAVLMNDYDNTGNNYRRNYAISLWFNLNKHSINSESYVTENSIFDYGNGKPKITYIYDNSDEFKKDKFIFYFTNADKSNYEITLPSQKWNHVVFNYFSSHVDLFINGVLERTFTFKDNYPSYSSTDAITLGNDQNLSGAVSNVTYYKNTLDPTFIANLYNLFIVKNPPI